MPDRTFIKQAALEMMAIVLSVLFALFLNSWWEGRVTAANHAKTLLLIQSELDANREDIVEAITYYHGVIDEITKVLPDGITDEEVAVVMQTCCQIMSGGTGRTAHEMAIITGLYSALDPNDAADIISAFVSQQTLDEAVPLIAGGITGVIDVEHPDKFVMQYYIFARSIAPSMEELLGVTDEAIATVERLTTD